MRAYVRTYFTVCASVLVCVLNLSVVLTGNTSRLRVFDDCTTNKIFLLTGEDDVGLLLPLPEPFVLLLERVDVYRHALCVRRGARGASFWFRLRMRREGSGGNTGHVVRRVRLSLVRLACGKSTISKQGV